MSNKNKPDCSRHKKEVAGITDMQQLGWMVGDLHYGALHEFVITLACKLYSDGLKDVEAGRIHLGNKLMKAGICMKKVERKIKAAWEISQPYMPDELPKVGEKVYFMEREPGTGGIDGTKYKQRFGKDSRGPYYELIKNN